MEKIMKKLLTASMLAGLLAGPAFAQDQDMTCAEFTALDATAQAKALAALDADDVDIGTTSSTTTEPSASVETEGAMDVTADAVLQACASNPDLTLPEAKLQIQAQ
ncbi:MAG: HdeA/HdeB family chaperone [Oricola sp.]